MKGSDISVVQITGKISPHTGGTRPIQIPGAELVRRLVLDNQVMIGSVNAAPAHWEMAVSDLAQACAQWGDHVAQLITHRHPADAFADALEHHGTDEIKTVLEWSRQQ